MLWNAKNGELALDGTKMSYVSFGRGKRTLILLPGLSGLSDGLATVKGKALLLATLVGGVSSLFCILLHKTEHAYEKLIRNPYLRIAAAGGVIVLLTLLLGTDVYLGSGMGIIEHIFHEGDTPWYSFALKMLFTALTLGAGFKGGEIVPSFTIGAAFGCVAASLMGLPMELVAACGMVGVFCGVTNSPVTSLFVAFELFGFDAMPFYLVTIAVSYMVSGHYSLYHEQRILHSKADMTLIRLPEDI